MSTKKVVKAKAKSKTKVKSKPVATKKAVPAVTHLPEIATAPAVKAVVLASTNGLKPGQKLVLGPVPKTGKTSAASKPSAFNGQVKTGQIQGREHLVIARSAGHSLMVRPGRMPFRMSLRIVRDNPAASRQVAVKELTAAFPGLVKASILSGEPGQVITSVKALHPTTGETPEQLITRLAVGVSEVFGVIMSKEQAQWLAKRTKDHLAKNGKDQKSMKSAAYTGCDAGGDDEGESDDDLPETGEDTEQAEG